MFATPTLLRSYSTAPLGDITVTVGTNGSGTYGYSSSGAYGSAVDNLGDLTGSIAYLTWETLYFSAQINNPQVALYLTIEGDNYICPYSYSGGAIFNSDTTIGPNGPYPTSGSVGIDYATLSTPTISLVASTTSTSSSITIPGTLADGDIGILVDCANGTITGGLPTGYTSLINQANSTGRVRISYKLLTTADQGASVSGMSGTTSTNKAYYVIRGASAFDAIVTFQSATGSTGDPSQRSMTTRTTQPPSFYVGAAFSDGSMSVSGSLSTNGTATTNTSALKIYYQIDNTPAAGTLTWDMSDGGGLNILGLAAFSGYENP